MRSPLTSIALCAVLSTPFACSSRAVSGTPTGDVPTVTDTPVAADTPVVTDTPIGVDTPVVTDVPVTNDVPAVNDADDVAAIDAPIADDTPVTVDAPKGADVPVVTDATATPDAPVVTDVPVVTDAPVATDVPADAGGCRSDRECAATTQVCDIPSGRCVDCVRDADCLTAGQACVANRCVAVTRCVSSRTCPGQVCDTVRGFCVDCVADIDCATDQVCRSNACVRAGCTPGAASCTGTSRRVCASDGVTYTTTPCLGATNATGQCTGAGVCGLACAAGFFNCDGNPANGCESTTSCNPLITGLGGMTGFGLDTNCLHANDDGSYAGPMATGFGTPVAIPIATAFPMGLQYFGTTYMAMYVNTNGNISFRAALSTYTPAPFPVAEQPIIAPWWGDVDTRGLGMPMRNNICFAVQPSRVVVTWDHVGYFSSHTDRLNTFQLVLLDRSDVRAGDLDVEFRYAQCQWTTGDASGGTGGMGGTPAQVGFDAGDRVNFLTLPNSRMASIVNVCTTTNVPGGTPGVWRFQIRSGTISM